MKLKISINKFCEKALASKSKGALNYYKVFKKKKKISWWFNILSRIEFKTRRK